MSRSEQRIWNNKIRRQKERKKHIIITVLTFCLVTIISVTASSFLSHAKIRPEDEVLKYYKSVAIEEGDTLWAIALQNMDSEHYDITSYINEVKQMNGLRTDNITEGMYLILPYY